MRKADTEGSASSYLSSYASPASLQRKKKSSAFGARKGAITSVIKGGNWMALVKWVTTGFVSRAPCRPVGVITALIVAQLGASTSFIVRIDFGQNLTGMADSPNPERPKNLMLGFKRSHPTLEI